MTMDAFLVGLKDRGLWLEVRTTPEKTSKLVLCGDQSATVDGIRKYIRLHREQIITHLLNDQARTSDDSNEPVLCNSLPDKHNHSDVTQAIAEKGTEDARFVTCLACTCQVDEQDCTVSAESLIFCVECGQSRNIGLLQPGEEIEAGILLFQQHGCARCGGHDWRVDPWLALTDQPRRSHGFLVCACVLEAREENTRTGARPASTVGAPWEPGKDEQQCCQCLWRSASIWYTDKDQVQRAYCADCFEKRDRAQASAA